MTDSLASEVATLARRAVALNRGGPFEATASEIVARLEGPLRVAIAGRTKAGKSTLLNALVGERLAATDAGECTRIVTWYQNAIGYSVGARLHGGELIPLRFSRAEAALDIALDGVTSQEIARIEVGWPSRRLEQMHLIDTPGLGSTETDVSLRTSVALLGEDGQQSTEADAVIYLMRHLHRTDAEFLEAFVDRSLAQPSPVNAVAILSRADEVGGGRPNALESAAHIARRYAADVRIRQLAPTVLPVAGLLAETALTLREDEVSWLRQLAALPAPEIERLLLSVDRFRQNETNPLSGQLREQLLQRLGLFGLRFAVGLIVTGEVATATELSRAMLDASGVRTLQRVIDVQFTARAGSLKGRVALASLRSLARVMGTHAIAGARELEAETERLEAGSVELAMLRLVHLVASGQVPFDDQTRAEIDRLAGGGTPAHRTGLADDASRDAVRAAALAGIERWRLRASSPLVDRTEAEAAEIAARGYEAIFAAPDRSSASIT